LKKFNVIDLNPKYLNQILKKQYFASFPIQPFISAQFTLAAQLIFLWNSSVPAQATPTRPPTSVRSRRGSPARHRAVHHRWMPSHARL
jgi:hypothetical protein